MAGGACRRAGQAGPVTRLMSCTEAELRTYRGLDLMPTFVAPSFKADPEHNDDYSAYNKPGAIMAWLTVRALPWPCHMPHVWLSPESFTANHRVEIPCIPCALG